MPGHRQLLDVLYDWDVCSGTEPKLARHVQSRRAQETPSMKAALEQTIETEIIPRLLLAHSSSIPLRGTKPQSAENRLRPEDVDEFTHLVLEHELAVASAYIDVLRSRGVSAERVILELLAPAAQRLGVLWEEDLRDFVDVTVGLSRIQHLLHLLSPAFQSEVELKDEPQTCLLAATPGEQHTLGVMIVEEFFRRSGWNCQGLPHSSIDEIARRAHATSFDVIGLSTSCELLLGATASAIEKLRRSSRNRNVVIIVGGQLFRQSPELVARVGADLAADDGTQAMFQLRRMRGTKTLG
ncbi:MAG: B12-binding domain-containing protein [Hyphomicrobiaceae bacterium]